MRTPAPDARTQQGDATLVLHASAAVVEGKGVLVLGRSGTGKSALTLQLMAYGAVLVSDDRTCVTLRDGVIWASAPDVIAGMIEARGVGLLTAEAAGPVPLSLAVDLDQMETERLPRPHSLDIMGQSLPLIHGVDHPAFPAAVLQYLKGGRTA